MFLFNGLGYDKMQGHIEMGNNAWNLDCAWIESKQCGNVNSNQTECTMERSKSVN